VVDCLLASGLDKTRTARFDQACSNPDETTGAKEAKNVVVALRKAPRLMSSGIIVWTKW